MVGASNMQLRILFNNDSIDVMRVARQMKQLMKRFAFDRERGIFAGAPGIKFMLRLTPPVQFDSILSAGMRAGAGETYVGITIFFTRDAGVKRKVFYSTMNMVVEAACATFDCRQNTFVNASIKSLGASAAAVVNYAARRRDFLDCFGFNVMSAAERLTVAPAKLHGNGTGGELTSREFVCYKCGQSNRACHFPIQNVYYSHVKVDIFYEILAGRYFTGYEQACETCTDMCTVISCAVAPLVTQPHPLYKEPSEALILCPGCNVHKGMYHFKAPTVDLVGLKEMYWHYIESCQTSGTQRVCDACIRARATRKILDFHTTFCCER